MSGRGCIWCYAERCVCWELLSQSFIWSPAVDCEGIWAMCKAIWRKEDIPEQELLCIHCWPWIKPQSHFVSKGVSVWHQLISCWTVRRGAEQSMSVRFRESPHCLSSFGVCSPARPPRGSALVLCRAKVWRKQLLPNMSHCYVKECSEGNGYYCTNAFGCLFAVRMQG